MHIYLAAPFFNARQLSVVKSLEVVINSIPGLTLYSPRVDGVLGDMSVEERAAAADRIFMLNCTNIDRAQLILAVIDDLDVGVIWEIGYAYKGGKPIVTYTEHNHGLNVMVQKCVRGHVRGIGYTVRVLNALARGDWDVLKNFQDFNVGIT